MSFETLFTLLLNVRQSVFVTLAVVLVAVFGMSFLHGVYDGREPPWRYIYGFVVHLMTALFSAAGALTVYHIMENGSLAVGRDGAVMIAVFTVAWLFLLLIVKRAVDFSMIRSVRSPFVLFLSWVIGWTTASVLDIYGLLNFPFPRPVLIAVPAFLVFLVIRILLSVLSRIRS